MGGPIGQNIQIIYSVELLLVLGKHLYQVILGNKFQKPRKNWNKQTCINSQASFVSSTDQQKIQKQKE